MKNEYSKGGLMVTDVECLDRALKIRQFIRASNINHPVSKIQAYLSNSCVNDRELKFEYGSIKSEETICSRAQSTINVLTDYYRSNLTSENKSQSEIDQIVDDVSSINISSFLKRKKLPLHSCVLKPLTDVGVETFGELIQEYEYNNDPDLSKRAKIILGTLPGNLKQLLDNLNDNTSCNENLKLINLENNTRKDINLVTTKEFQRILKKALCRVEEISFKEKLGLNKEFELSNISETRNMCKNAKLRSIYFRLIHNDFYTRVRMKKFKMVESDECQRCGSQETLTHLLWECYQAKNIWGHFNKLLSNIGCPLDIVNNYDEVFTHASSTAVTIIKIKIIQEMIQIERPINWSKEKVINVALEIINIEKYISVSNNKTTQFNKDWKRFEENIYKYKFLSE
jgi:hypothetical protein